MIRTLCGQGLNLFDVDSLKYLIPVLSSDQLWTNLLLTEVLTLSHNLEHNLPNTAIYILKYLKSICETQQEQKISLKHFFKYCFFSKHLQTCEVKCSGCERVKLYGYKLLYCRSLICTNSTPHATRSDEKCWQGHNAIDISSGHLLIVLPLISIIGHLIP